MSTTPLRAASLNSALDESDDASVKFEVQTLRRVDRRLLPILGLMYAVAVIDGGNLGLARTAGMGEDLGLDIGSRYSIVSTFFFIPYILLQLPSNLILRYVGARTCIAFYVISWGAVQLGMGFVPSWGWLVVCRTLLGVFEAGFFSAVTFIITTWYRRHEVQTRLAFFYLLTQAIAGFSAILAYAISLLKGKCGLNGWRWIFIIEGAGTIAFGIVSCAFLPDFPDRNTFLTKEETKLILDRIEQDRGDALPDKVTTAKVLRHMGDPMLWAYALMFMAATMPAYAISFFSTIIISGMGWDVGSSLLLTAPPYIFAVSSLPQQDVLDASRVFWPIARIMWSATPRCRSVTTAVVASSRGIGGIIASTVFRQQDYPRYINGIWTMIGLQLGLLAVLGITTFVFMRRNRLSRKGKLSAPLEGQPGFFYTL
ncbi:high-affinity nicotinic acid transporter [Moniliophthora roreri]|nr:high-affinity nicotinic acid transporter [Moniliophthora roreri]